MAKIYGVDEPQQLPDLLDDDKTCTDLRLTNHIPVEWFNQGTPDKDLAARDLYNLFPTTIRHRNLRNDLPLFDTVEGKAGPGTTVDGQYQAYQPRNSFKGALARMVMYVAVVYGKPSAWTGNGAIVFNDFEAYPLLSQRAVKQYLDWHNSYPPSAVELELVKQVEAIQGNTNPFITHPEIAEYLWGEKSSQPYIPTIPPDDPDTPPTPIPLHKSYSIDETIYLYSPHIDPDATWSIAGTPVISSIKASEIGIGIHELHFTSPHQSGKITIIVQ